MARPLKTKPGAEKRRFSPDHVSTYFVPDTPPAPAAPAEEEGAQAAAAQEGTQAPAAEDGAQTAPAAEDGAKGWTLLPFLISAMPEQKRTNIKELMKHGQVRVAGQVATRHDHLLMPGAKVEVNFTRQWPVFHHPRLKIVYEDDDIIVVNKGYGLLSMGNDRVKDGTAYSIVKDYLKWVDPRQKVFIVHRLDQNTSGLMMFAKTQQAKETMQHNWNNMVLSRRYLALVEGRPQEDSGVIRTYLAENSQYEVYVTDNPDEGQLAVTRWKRIKNVGALSLLEVELDTGRKNQIRVHMKHIGHPIAGDKKYGAKTSPLHRLCLHAYTLEFVHPVTRRRMSFTAPPPAGFKL